MKIILTFILVMFMGCNAHKEASKKGTVQKKLTIEKEVAQEETTAKTPMKNESSMKQETQVEVLAEHSHGGYETLKYLVIKDQKALQEIYGKVNMMRRPGIPIPEIDWKNEMVIALFMGQKNTGGYSISVDKITTLNDDKVEFSIKETKHEGMVTTVICQPFYFCKVQRTDKEVIFKKVE